MILCHKRAIFLLKRKEISPNIKSPRLGPGKQLLKKKYSTIALGMKLAGLLILVATLHVGAKGFSQTITLTGKDMPLRQVFDRIEDQTGYGIFIDGATLAASKPVTINFKEATIELAMKACLKEQPFPLTFTITGHTINVIKAKENDGHRPAADAFPSAIPPTVIQELKGQVMNDAGEPLQGASVEIQNDKTGTFTNERGIFTLRNISSDAVLEITFTGYQKTVVKLTGVSSLAVVLKLATGTLDQLQIIAYGTTSQRLNTGNVTTVTSKEIEEQPVSNPLLALEGRVPGLFITQNTGVANGEVVARVQGQNSINSGNDPLVVVDGVPIPATLQGTGLDGPVTGSAGTGGSALSYINPSDIESITVLKDADATAIYGTRAANGAILITTKKGKAGKTKMAINLQQGLGEVTRKVSMLNTHQYLGMRYEAFSNDGIDWTDPSVSANDLKVYDTTRYTDWQKTLIGGEAQYTNVNASISGGTQAVQYLIGASYHRESSVFPGSMSDQKGSMHFNLTSNSGDQKFKTQFSGSYMVDGNHLPSADLTNTALEMEPDAPALYKNGTLNWQPDSTGASTFINPLAYTLNTNNNTTKNLISNLQLAYTILPGLEARSSFGYTNLQTNIFIPVPLTSVRPEQRATTPRSAQYLYRTLDSWIIEPQLTYKKAFGGVKLDGLLGTTIEQDNSNTLALLGSGYNSDLVLNDIGSAASIQPSSTIWQYKYNAVFGRLNFNWLDRYVLNLTARRDGSSHFGDANKFHDFASVGGAWIFSQEGFFKNKTGLSFGKLRASYGTTGSDQTSDYTRLSFYGNTYAGIPYQNTVGLVPSNLSNPYIEWELTRKFQSGIDLGFLQDRILIDITYSHNRSSNQLLPYALPSTTGFTSITSNFPATVQNTDWEVSLNITNVKTEHFSWKSGLNLTIPRNKVISFPNIQNSSYADGFEGVIIGQPLGVQKVFHYLDVDPATGLYEVADFHGNPTSSPNSTTDANVLISTLPKFYGGFRNSITYNGFQLEFLFQYVRQIGKKDMYYYNGGISVPGMFFRGSSNQPVTVLNRWQKPGDVKPIARFNTDGTVIPWPTPPTSDAGFSYGASFVRLKNLSFSWEFPRTWLQKARLTDCRIYFQGQNLLTITRYTGLDPENQTVNSLPPLRIMTMGLQMGW